MSETEAPDTNETEAPDLEPVPPPEPDEEGEQAEPEQGETPQPEEEAPQPESSAELARRDKALDGLNKHVAKRLTEILGDDATAYTPCEICTAFGTPGWRPGGDLPAEVKVIVSHALGVLTADDLEPDPYARRCDTCKGRGSTRTGSLNPDQEALTCVDCSGNGWVPVGDRRAAQFGLIPNGAAAAPPVAATTAAGEPVGEAALPPEAQRLRDLGYVVMAPPNLTGS